MSELVINDLHASIETDGGEKEILRGVTLSVESGRTHAVMGPNGSGKSTLAYVIAGHPKYQVTSGSITLDGEDVLSMTVDERARAGLFLAMQYPVEVPGVSVSNFLRTSVTAVKGEAPKLRTWVKEMKEAMADLQMDPAFAERSVAPVFAQSSCQGTRFAWCSISLMTMLSLGLRMKRGSIERLPAPCRDSDVALLNA